MLSRFDIALGRAKLIVSQEEKTLKEMDAVERARELSKMDPIPERALDYIMTYIWEEDMNNKKFLIGLAHYAQAVEGLTTEDPEYQITSGAIEWFQTH